MIEALARAVFTTVVVFLLSAMLEGYFMLITPEYMASILMWSFAAITTGCLILIYRTLELTWHEKTWGLVRRCGWRLGAYLLHKFK